MKTLKSILIISLCILAFGSCKKDNDLEETDKEPSGKLILSQFGMEAEFPLTGWSNQFYYDFDDPGYEMECILTYLKDSKEITNEKENYSVCIYFTRLVSTFENEEKANGMIKEFKNIYEGKPEYSFVSDITSAQISKYNASKMECKQENSIEESYFIYQNNRLYRIVIVMPEDKIDNYYAGCKEIIDTLVITGN